MQPLLNSESPTETQSLPAGHGAQSAAPTLGLYIPAGHAVQANADAPPLENDPGWQLPVGAVRLVPLQYLPAGHGAQTAAPTLGLYIPTLQFMHAAVVPLPAVE